MKEHYIKMWADTFCILRTIHVHCNFNVRLLYHIKHFYNYTPLFYLENWNGPNWNWHKNENTSVCNLHVKISILFFKYSEVNKWKKVHAKKLKIQLQVSMLSRKEYVALSNIRNRKIMHKLVKSSWIWKQLQVGAIARTYKRHVRLENTDTQEN